MSDNVVPFSADPKAAILARIQSAAPIAGGDGASPSPPSASEREASHSGAPGRKRNKARDGGATTPPGDGGGDGDDGALDLNCARLPLTDLGNAQRFVLRHGDAFLFVHEWGWLAWDGRRWTRNGARALLSKAVHGTVMAIRAEAEAFANSGGDFVVSGGRAQIRHYSDSIRDWALKSQGHGRISCIAHDVRNGDPGLAAPYLVASPEDFDTDPMLLNVLNGTLRFARPVAGEGAGEADGEGDYVSFRPHDRNDRITRLAPADFDPEATCPIYDAALERVQPEASVRRHLHCWGGVSLTGDVSLQRMAFWYGKGGNMKSTLLDAWAHVAGDYATTVAVESFLDQGRGRRGGDPTPDLADLVGVRMLKTSEPERGAKIAEALVKTVTGDEMLKVRFLNRDFFPLRVMFKLTMFGNYKPRIDGTDDGIWRRVIFLPWLVQVPREDRDRHLLRKMKGEAPGILNRLLDGVRDFLDNGLVMPESVEAATAAFRTESDPLGRFLEVCVERREAERVQSSQLYRLYQAWCIANGERAWTATAFGRALRERGFLSKQSNVIWWLDMGLRQAVSDFVSNFEATPDKWQAKRQEGGGDDPPA